MTMQGSRARALALAALRRVAIVGEVVSLAAHIDESHPSMSDAASFSFTAAIWGEYWSPRTGQSETTDKDLSRWVASLRASGICVASSGGICQVSTYTVDREQLLEARGELHDAAEAALAACEAESVLPPTPPVSARRCRRRSSAPHDVAERYGVSASTVRRWAREMGAPHRRSGRRILFDPDEVDLWIHEHGVASHEPRCESSVMAGLVSEMRSRLNMSLPRISDLLGVSAGAIRGWRSGRIRTAPVDAAERAREALRAGRRRPALVLSRTEEEVAEAFSVSCGVVSTAAELLGVSRGSAARLADLYGVPRNGLADPLVSRFGRDDIRKAMCGARYVKRTAAVSLGLPGPSLGVLIERYGMASELEQAERLFWAQEWPRMVRSALEACGWSADEAAGSLGVSVSKVYRDIRSHKIKKPGGWGRAHHMTKSELRGILEDARSRGISRHEMARSIGIDHSVWRRLSKEHGLEALWESLRTTRHRGRGEWLTAELTRDILERAAKRGQSATSAAKEAGFAAANVLRNAAERHGMPELYDRVAIQVGRGRPRESA